MSLNDIVSVTISAQTTTPSRLGFGTPLLCCYHTEYADLIREYKALSAIADDGFADDSPALSMATRVFSQNPKPNSIKIGRRQTGYTQIMRIIPINTTQGYVYTFKVNGTTVTYTVGASATVAIICTALTPLITAISGVTAADNTTHVTVTSTVNTLVDYEDFDEPDSFRLKDMTVDPGIAADLSAIEAVDPDGWYCLLLDSQSAAEVAAAAAWIEARKKIFIYNTSDSECVDVAVTTDIMSTLQGFAYARTAGLFSQRKLLNWSSCGWAGNRLPSDPGSSTWSFKTLAGILVDSTLTGGQVSVIEAKGGNVYRVIAGVNVTTFGITASGEYIDITRGIDWLDARIKERIYGMLVNNEKIPYTDSGVDLVRGQVAAQLQLGIQAGLLAADPAPTITAPKVADVDTADKANRILPDVNFQATLAGAIHQLQISGVLTL